MSKQFSPTNYALQEASLHREFERWLERPITTVGEAALLVQEHLGDYWFRFYESRGTLFCLVFIVNAVKVDAQKIRASVRAAEEALRAKLPVVVALRFHVLHSGVFQAADTVGRLSPDHLAEFLEGQEQCLMNE